MRYSRSKLDLMLDNEPFEYASMILDSTIQDYLDMVDAIGQSQLKCYVEQFSERYPKNITEDISKETMM